MDFQWNEAPVESRMSSLNQDVLETVVDINPSFMSLHSCHAAHLYAVATNVQNVENCWHSPNSGRKLPHGSTHHAALMLVRTNVALEFQPVAVGNFRPCGVSIAILIAAFIFADRRCT